MGDDEKVRWVFFMLKCRYLCDYYYGFVCNRSVVLELQYTQVEGSQILAIIIYYLPTKMGSRLFFFYLLIALYRHFHLNNVINEQKMHFNMEIQIENQGPHIHLDLTV